ncbi:Ran-binding-domain-containing protein, partial [Microthyrium microscopicum]
ITQHAVNYAIRSGITITTGYAFKQCTRLLKTTADGRDREEIADLQQRLQSKIKIIAPAINLLELIAARGNTSLDSAVTLTKNLRLSIQSLGMRLAKAADQDLHRDKSKPSNRIEAERELQGIVLDIKKLLTQIEDAVPLINLAITTSGVNLSTGLPPTVSPSRLLQASTFLTTGDAGYNLNPTQPTQIGPAFTLSLYMLFGGHSLRHSVKGIREMTWKEVVHKARVKLLRVPLDNLYDLPGAQSNHRHAQSNPDDDSFLENVPSEGLTQEFAYQLLIVEDLEDDRVHTFDDNELKPGPYDDVNLAGIREILPIHEISKIFYADTGKILNIGSSSDGEPNNPVLLLRRDPNAVPPRRMVDRNSVEEEENFPPDSPTNGFDDDDDDDDDEARAQLHRESSTAPEPEPPVQPEPITQPWRFPSDLNQEWMAVEVYVEEPDSSEDEDEEDITVSSPLRPSTNRADSVDPITTGLSSMHIRSSPLTPKDLNSSQIAKTNTISSPATVLSPRGTTSLPALKTSLSLLELLIRLTALQQFQQCPHLAIEDELLNFFLAESSSTGAGADAERRKMMRSAARRDVGFDPYAESPMKFRGEEYLHQHEQQDGWDEGGNAGFSPSSTGSRGRFESEGGLDDSPSGYARRTKQRYQQEWEGARSPLSPRAEFAKAGARNSWQARSGPSTPSGHGRSRMDAVKGQGMKQSPLGRRGGDATPEKRQEKDGAV